MILIFFLCLKLSILHLCVSDLGYQCETDDSNNNPEIFLIDGWDYMVRSVGMRMEYQNVLNSRFYELCSNYYNISLGSLEESKTHKNVIRFAVPDYNDRNLPENFVYAGNISKIDNAVCTKTNKTQPEFYCNEIANLVSKSVEKLNDGHLYDFVQNMQLIESRYYYPIEITHEESCEPLFPKNSDLTIVLLCLRGPVPHKEVNIQPLQLIQEADCSSSNTLKMNRLLAVLAPEPFELPSEYTVPTIFYKTPYLFSEYKTGFPNSMNLVPWRLLKYGFLTFIQRVGWQRVAIVTDDSEYSLDFEDELTALFNKERLTYTVIRCEDANCEMKKIVEKLNNCMPRIVIANVEEKHIQYLFQNSYNKITWLVRDMVGKRHEKYLNNNQDAFSISLSIDTYNTKGCNVEDNILTGLSSIAQTYQNIPEKDFKVKKREFYRRFASITKQLTPRITEGTVVVHKLYTLQVVSNIYVNATGAKLMNFTNPFKFKPTDGTAHCLVTTYDYHNPCEDPAVIFLMFVFMIFLLTLLLITCYFDKTSPFNDIRYQNF